MPIRYELDDLRRRVVVTIEGLFTQADFRAIIERRRADNTGAYGILYDLRGMTGEPTIADLQQFMSAGRADYSAARANRAAGHRALHEGLHVRGHGAINGAGD
jgi:hypothetical protein